MTNLDIQINNTSDDQPVGSSGINWVSVSVGNDFLIFTTSPSLAGASIPSSFTLSSGGVFLNGSQQIFPFYYLAHPGGSPQTYAIPLMGNQNTRYVMAFVFDGATTSEPVLEAWDNSGLTTTNAVTLGAGTPANSWMHGITTTAGLPGSNWTGSTLAGSSNGHFLWLNNQNGALTGAGVLYCNLQVIVPASQTQGGAETPVLVCKYTTT
jgi:hypothetical protein